MSGKLILPRQLAAWQSQQVQEPCILVNPRDPSRLVMFYSGVPAANRKLCYIGKAWAMRSDPMTWHPDEANPIFGPSEDGWDCGTIRLDTVLYIPQEDAYYIYYSGTKGNVQDRIGLAVCPAGNDGYSGLVPAAVRRVGDVPLLSPHPEAPFFEEMVSQSAVWRQWHVTEKRWEWFLYYSYRGKDGILPGIRLATSRDGRNWQRQFSAQDPRGMGQIFFSTPATYYEWHQIFRVGDTYVLSIEGGVRRGERWRPIIAVSKHPDRGWRQLDVDAAVQTRWEGYSDKTIFHVATPAFYQIDGRWYLYVQACPLPASRNYIEGQWDLWCFPCDREMATFPGYANVFIPAGTERTE